MSFDSAQRDYDRQTPYNKEPREKDCSTCEGLGEVFNPNPTFWQKVWSIFGFWPFIECPNCNGEGLVPETEEDAWDRAAEKGDRMRDDEIDRRMGL